jgi:hypothetical protein
VLKRILHSVIIGTLFQMGVYLLFAFFGLPGLSVIFLWGWILFLGVQSPHTQAQHLAEWVAVIAVDNLLYAPLVFFLLWNRDLKRKAGGTNIA